MEPSQGCVVLKNNSSSPVLIKRHEQLCQVRHTMDVSDQHESEAPSGYIYIDRSSEVSVDPSKILGEDDRLLFQKINQKYSQVFSPTLGGYNGKSGQFLH